MRAKVLPLLLPAVLLLLGGFSLAEDKPAPPAAPAKPRVAILAFDSRVVNPKVSPELLTAAVGAIPLMLTTELDKTGRFQLLEREKLDKIKEELLRRNDPFFDASTLPPLGKLIGAEYLIAGALTDFDPAISGAELTLKIPGLGGIEAKVSYALVRIELRLMSVKTGEIVQTADASAVIRNVAGGIEASYQGVTFGAGAFKKTPLGEAFHEALGKASKQLVKWLDETPPGN